MRLFSIAAIMAVVTLSLSAADLVGTWKGTMETQMGNTEVTVTFQPGTPLAGRVKAGEYGSQIQNAKLDGDHVYFDITIEPGKVSYEGIVSGNEMKLNVTGTQGNKYTLVCKREQRPAAQSGTPGMEPAGSGSRPGMGRGGPLGGAAAGFVQNPKLDTDRPELPADLKRGGVLIFSKTSGFREEAAISASNAALAVIANQHGWPYFVTENGAVMNHDQLAQFRLVVWNNTSGDSLSDEQKAAFQSWVEAGGSFLGIHGAGGDPVAFPAPRTVATWKWFVDKLLGAQFTSHSHIMPGDIHVEDTRSALTKSLPAVWRRPEEWYAFTESPRGKPGYHIILTVDEKTYTPERATMGTDHPLAWWHCVGKGHALYSALGHAGTMYTEPLFIRFLDNAMSWSLAESGKACPGGN